MQEIRRKNFRNMQLKVVKPADLRSSNRVVRGDVMFAAMQNRSTGAAEANEQLISGPSKKRVMSSGL